MYCISIAQESRRLALADMLNASRQCDLLELRLDFFEKAPDLTELFAAKPRPVIVSCRRPRDGGRWEGNEDERLALLRQCIINKAEHVEIELDVADQIRPFPGCKRVIAYTNLDETPSDIAEIYAEAQTKKPDVIKLMTLVRTPEEAWPLVQLLAKPAVPTVVVGLGPAGVMLTLLGRKIGAPWTYAALERGMEAYPGQPTIHDLNTVYRYPDFGKGMRLIGVTGFDDHAFANVACLNAALGSLNLPARAMPVTVGGMKLFRRIMEAVKMAAIVVSEEHELEILEIVQERDATCQEAGAADLLLHKSDKWVGSHTRCRAAFAALERTLRTKSTAENPVQGRVCMVVGTNVAAQSLARMLQARGAILIIASKNKNAAQQLAQSLQCRYVQFEALYTTSHDVLVIADGTETGLRPGYLRPGMIVMDITTTLKRSALLQQAADRSCLIVEPRDLLLEHFGTQARLITGKDVPIDVLKGALPERLFEEAE